MCTVQSSASYSALTYDLCSPPVGGVTSTVSIFQLGLEPRPLSGTGPEHYIQKEKGHFFGLCYYCNQLN